MSGCPKDKHKALLYRLGRAQRFENGANEAMGRLWREVKDARDTLAAPAAPAPDNRDELTKCLHSTLGRWMDGISDGGWSGIWGPREIRELLAIVASAVPPKRGRRRRRRP